MCCITNGHLNLYSRFNSTAFINSTIRIKYNNINILICHVSILYLLGYIIIIRELLLLTVCLLGGYYSFEKDFHRSQCLDNNIRILC